MKLVLDFVFNHCGKRSNLVQVKGDRHLHQTGRLETPLGVQQFSCFDFVARMVGVLRFLSGYEAA